MEKAIQKAIEGGWKYKGNSKTDETVREGHVKVYVNDSEDTKLYIDSTLLLLDPLFWQALGKSLGWIDTTYTQRTGKIYAGRPVNIVHRQDWLSNWHKMVDHLANGGDIETFFKQLLSNTK